MKKAREDYGWLGIIFVLVLMLWIAHVFAKIEAIKSQECIPMNPQKEIINVEEYENKRYKIKKESQ